MRRKNYILTTVLLIVFGAAAVAGGFYLKHTMAVKEIQVLEENHALEVAALKEQIPEKEYAYVLSKDMTADSMITEDDILFVEVDKSICPESVISDKSLVIGNRIKVNLKTYALITEEMLYTGEEIASDLREQQFSYINLPDKLMAGDVIDIRIKFPTGQDYTLLSKKTVTDMEKVLDDSNKITKATMWTVMNEDEIVRMGSATVDAFLNGASIYAIEYFSPYAQDGARVNYPENANVLEMIKNDSGIVDLAAFNLEASLRTDLEASLLLYSANTGSKINLPKAATSDEVVPAEAEMMEQSPVDQQVPEQTVTEPGPAPVQSAPSDAAPSDTGSFD